MNKFTCSHYTSVLVASGQLVGMISHILIPGIEVLRLVENDGGRMEHDKNIQTNNYPQGQKQLHA
jgi:hypothetical protein